MLVPQDTSPERTLVRGSIVRPSVETCELEDRMFPEARGTYW